MSIPGASLTRTIRVSDTMGEILRNTKKSKSGTATASNGILTIYSPGIDQYCYCFLPIYAPRGTVIEVKFEARQDTATSEGRIMLDQYANREDVIGGLVDYKEIDGTTWKPYTFTRSGDHRKPYASVTFGFNTASVGKVHFRNIVINIYNVMSPGLDTRVCMIRHENDTDWVIDDTPGRFSNVGVLGLEVKKGQDFIKVNFARLQSWGMPVCFAQIQHNGGRTNYHTVVFADVDFARVYIVRSTTNEVVMPMDVTGTFMISFAAFAF